MTSLGFLEVDAAAGNAVSPIPAHATGDAAVVRNAVGIVDVSLMHKTELQGDLDHELGTAVRRGDGWYCPVTPTRALVLGDAADGPGALDVTGVFGAAYGPYLWEVVVDAATRLGGQPVGVEALDA